jgi:hypothetical protein
MHHMQGYLAFQLVHGLDCPLNSVYWDMVQVRALPTLQFQAAAAHVLTECPCVLPACWHALLWCWLLLLTPTYPRTGGAVCVQNGALRKRAICAYEWDTSEQCYRCSCRVHARYEAGCLVYWREIQAWGVAVQCTSQPTVLTPLLCIILFLSPSASPMRPHHLQPHPS